MRLSVAGFLSIQPSLKAESMIWISEELYKLGADGSVEVDRMAELDKALQDVRIAEKTLSALIQTNDSVKKTKKTKPCSKRQIPMVA